MFQQLLDADQLNEGETPATVIVDEKIKIAIGGCVIARRSAK